MRSQFANKDAFVNDGMSVYNLESMNIGHIG
jgi:hypothetical protein